MKSFSQLVASVFTFFLFAVAQVTLAQGSAVGGGPGNGGGSSVGPGPGPTPGGGGSTNGLSYKLQNPLQFDSLQSFIVAILNIIIVLATPIVVIFIIFAGFKYVTARGNPNDIQEATRALTYAVIGGVLIIGAVAIAEIIKNLVDAFAA